MDNWKSVCMCVFIKVVKNKIGETESVIVFHKFKFKWIGETQMCQALAVFLIVNLSLLLRKE